MYSGCYKQLAAQEYISKAESSRVIEKVLAYAQEPGADVIADLKEPFNKLSEILSRYFEGIRKVEQTIRSWEVNIHSNYSTKGRQQERFQTAQNR